jgi:hypothetical protein
MIPSTPRRTWLFLGATLLLYFAPDLLLSEAWNHAHPIVNNTYQGVLVLLGFAYGPAICRALVVREVGVGPLRTIADLAMASMATNGRRPPPLVLAEHPSPFVLTAGLLPGACQIFVSSGLAARLSPSGLRFLLARASVHATLLQRLAAFLPILAFTVLIPDDLKSLTTWLLMGGFMALWLCLHWLLELAADRQAAAMVGNSASAGLRDVLAATASPLGWLTPGPPLRWRLRAVERRV